MSENASFIIKNALLASKLSRRMSNRLSVHGISLTEYLIMDYLNNSHQRAIPRIELAEYVSMSASGITRLLLPMEKINIVKKMANPRDARQSLVELTEIGQQLYKEVSVSFEHSAADMLKGVNHSQIKSVTGLYDKLF